MRVLVTGANGHLGGVLVPELLKRGHAVVPFVRASADLRSIEALNLQPALGDVLDRASIADAADGCDAIVNLAAVYKTRAADPDEILRPAAEGIENVLRVAKDLGVGRVVHTSSIAAVGFSDTPITRDESQWNDRPENAYYRAKTESERIAWRLADELGLDLVVVNPAAILGPGDWRITPSTAYVRDLANGRSVTLRGGTNYVDVRDVALAHAAALQHGVPGERYLVGGENVEYERVGAIVGELTGTTPRHLSYPRWLVLAYVGFGERFAALAGREPTSRVDEVTEVAGRYAWFDTAKAEAAFGYTPSDARTTLRATLEWLAERGELLPEIAERVWSAPRDEGRRSVAEAP